MRLLSSSVLTSVLVLFSSSLVHAAAKEKVDTSTHYLNKYAAAGGATLKLTDTSYSSLTKTPRNHTLVALLTAQGARFGCKLCQDFQPEWELLSKQWLQHDPAQKGRVLFATLDFVDGKNSFQSLMLQTAPVVLMFSPTTGSWAPVSGTKEPARYDFSGGPTGADGIHPWIVRNLPSEEIPHPEKFVRPIDYVRIAIITTASLGVLTASVVAYPYVLPLISSRKVWAAGSIIAILLFTSGHMFNHIRGAPYIASDGKGGISYFAGGFQNQYGLESQIVAALYGALALCTGVIALRLPRIADPKSQQVAVIGWTAAMFFVYSFLMSIFRFKNGGYPFYLPPF